MYCDAIMRRTAAVATRLARRRQCIGIRQIMAAWTPRHSACHKNYAGLSAWAVGGLLFAIGMADLWTAVGFVHTSR